MIYVGNKRVEAIRLNRANVNAVYVGPKKVWDREVELLKTFKKAVLADGGIYDEELFTTEFFRHYPTVKNEAIVLTVCGAYKAGIIYGINCITGQAVKFTFGRTSVGTYIDKYGKLQTVGANIPRIDYDPVGLWLRGYLFENGMSQLFLNSLFEGNIIGWTTSNVVPSYPSQLSSRGRRFLEITKQNAGNANIYSNTVMSGANNTIAYRVTLRAGTANSATIALGATIDSGYPVGGLWGDSLTTGFVKKSGPGTLTRDVGTVIIVAGLSTTEDTVVEVWRKYVNSTSCHARVYPGNYTISNIGDSVLFSTPQMEINALGVCTSQMDASNGQVTRTGDTLVSQTDLIQDAEGTILIEGSQLGGYSNNTMLIRGGTGRLWYHDVNPVFLYMWDGTTLLNRNAYYSNGLKAKVAGSWKAGGQMKLGINGSPLQSGPYDGSFGSPGNITIAGAHSGKIQSHLRAFAIIHRQLSDAEHIALTQP